MRRTGSEAKWTGEEREKKCQRVPEKEHPRVRQKRRQRDENEELGEDSAMRVGQSLNDISSPPSSLLCYSTSLSPSLPPFPRSLNLSILLLSSRPAQTGVKSSGASKAAVWRLDVMWEPQQPCLQTSQTAAATIDPQPARAPQLSLTRVTNCSKMQSGAPDKRPIISWIW